ncbi:prepilin peptidase [Paludisphaera mucosa]|uniref:Prepilin peptidase n=1 Tax=Paludisphaera mucosa TaxID=3030827 RepID=A0ABT6FJE8_9BACT|nr:prepilin peptidase [Paludisphaera mucosa]MDG3007701.1 prepilin peptidase [Paludisphaera mucosa]
MTSAHYLVIGLLLFVLGACVGSFLNVCIHRIPLGQSLIRPRSRCPKCLAAIATRHNVPILGWLILGGRCRGCGLPISMRYPCTEALVGLISVGVFSIEAALSPVDIVDRGLVLVGLRLFLELSLAAFVVTASSIAIGVMRPS